MIHKVFKIVCGGLLVSGLCAVMLSVPGCNKESSSSMKKAGQEVGQAAKDTGNAIKSEVHQGAKKVEQSTD